MSQNIILKKIDHHISFRSFSADHITPASIRAFQRIIYTHFESYGRHELPWRKTTNPYHIMVSEIMLQQTQVNRVIPYYRTFFRRFPNIKKLATAQLSDILSVWQGLGYNRRARMLRDAARILQTQYKGNIPSDFTALCALPGIGPATAAGVMVFAYNKPAPYLETNTRSVILHFFFRDKEDISDSAVRQVLERVMDTAHPRKWYAAMLDYGVEIKKIYNPGKRSKHHNIQKPFKGSLREVRGAIMRALVNKTYSYNMLLSDLPFAKERIQDALNGLKQEGLITKKGNYFCIPD